MNNKSKYLSILIVIFLCLSGIFFIFSLKNTVFFEQKDGNIIGTGSFNAQSLSGDIYIYKDNKDINDIIDTNLDKALELTLLRFKKTKGKDVSSLILLQRIYKDKGDYDNSIRYGDMLLNIINKGFVLDSSTVIYGNKVIHNKNLTELLEDRLEVLIFTGKILDADILINQYKDKNVDLTFYSGLIFYKKGQYKEAIVIFDDIKKTHSRYIIATYLKAKAYLNLKNYKNALDVLSSGYCAVAEKRKLGWIYCYYYNYKGFRDVYKAMGDNDNYNKYNEKFNNHVKEIYNGKQIGDDGKIISKNVINAIILNATYE